MKNKSFFFFLVLAVFMAFGIGSIAQKPATHVVFVDVTNNSLLEECNAQICLAYDGTIGGTPVSGMMCVDYDPQGNYRFEIIWGFSGIICPYLTNECNYIAEDISCSTGALGRTTYVYFKVGGEPIE